MKILLLLQYLLVVALLQYTGDVTGQLIVAPPTCSGNTFTFRCTVGGDMNGITIWRVGGSSECLLRHTSAGNTVRCGPHNAFTATTGAGFGTSGTSFSSTLSGTATLALNGILVECFGPDLERDPENMVGASTVQTLGPPSVPMLSCVGLSELTNGTVNVTVNWTLSGGDNADFYLINIATNALQTPYGGPLNITNANTRKYELTDFMAGYKYNITVRGGTVNCGGLEGSESKTLTITPQVPATPMSDVCAVYDERDGTLQIIESTWNKVDDVTVSENCTNGNHISPSYDLSYTTDSGTLNATCIVNGTNCSNDTCRYKLQNNTADSRCQPPVSKFSNDDVTVSVTARNVVGRSKPSVPRSITGRNIDLRVHFDTTNLSSAFVECTFERRYNCTIDYGTGPSYTNLVYSDMDSTTDQKAIIRLSQKIRGDITYNYILSAESSSRCVRVLGRFRAGCKEADLTGQSGTLNPERCADRGFMNSSSITDGVVCYNGTTAGSRAVYICNDGFVLMEVNETRVCQSDGMWNGSIPQCTPEESDQIGPTVGGVIGGTIGVFSLLVLAIVIIALWYQKRRLHMRAEQCDGVLEVQPPTNSINTHSGLTPLHKAARGGDLDEVRDLIEKRSADVNIKHTRSGVFPLHMAAEGGHVKIVKYLIGQGADINVKESTDCTPLHMAALQGHKDVVEYLAEKEADLTIENMILRTPLHSAAKGGHKDIVKYFVDVKRVDINIKDGFGKVPLHLAAGEGRLDTVRYLVDQTNTDVNIKDMFGLTPLHRAARRGRKDVVKYLVTKGADIYNEDNNQRTPLHWAAEEGHTDTVKCLVDNGVCALTKDCDGMTPFDMVNERQHMDIVNYLKKLPVKDRAAKTEVKDVNKQSKQKEFGLHMAARGGDLDKVRKIAEEGGDVNFQLRPSGVTPLHMAAEGGHLNIVVCLVGNGANIEVKENTECTPLHMAAMQGHQDVVEYLVGKGADVSSTNIILRTPLHFAAKGGHERTVKYLVSERKADISTKDGFGKLPLHLAAGEGHLNVVEYLVDDKANDIAIKDMFGLTPLHRAARRGQKEIVKYLVGKQAGVDNGDDNKRTPLHWAAEGGHEDTVAYLVCERASRFIEDCDGMTPVHVAAASGHFDTVKYFVDQGADINIHDHNGRTLLHVAAREGHYNTVESLVKEGANVNTTNKDGMTPLHVAAERGHSKTVEYLVEQGTDVNIRDHSGWTPLHVAAKNGHYNTVESLVKKRANITATNKDGMTPLHMAAEKDHSKIVEYLVDEGADINIQDHNKWTPLHVAAKKGHYSTVERLVKKRANITATNKDGMTPLHMAAEKDRSKIVEYLVDEGADIDIQDHNKWTPMHVAAKEGRKSTVECLVKKGAKINIKDKDGRTPLNMAAEENYIEVEKYLSELIKTHGSGGEGTKE